jgi:NADPH-dependent 2,4-dienoyl-CoA reductase/sulfur reductase-like enzyme
LEPAAVPLAQAVGTEVGQVLSRAHRDRGVDLRCGVTVTKVTGEGVRLADGEVVEGDEILVAIGSQPNTDWLAGSGLTVDDGVVCDEYCQADWGYPRPTAGRVYAAGDVARWHNPLFGTSMRIEHRTNAVEQGMAAARNLLRPQARKSFAPVPYIWSDQYDMKIQAFGYLRGHDEAAVVDGDLDERRFVAAYRTGDRLTGALAVGMPPKAIRGWRQAIAARTAWRDALREQTSAATATPKGSVPG